MLVMGKFRLLKTLPGSQCRKLIRNILIVLLPPPPKFSVIGITECLQGSKPNLQGVTKNHNLQKAVLHKGPTMIAR